MSKEKISKSESHEKTWIPVGEAMEELARRLEVSGIVGVTADDLIGSIKRALGIIAKREEILSENVSCVNLTVHDKKASLEVKLHTSRMEKKWHARLSFLKGKRIADISKINSDNPQDVKMMEVDMASWELTSEDSRRKLRAKI